MHYLVIKMASYQLVIRLQTIFRTLNWLIIFDFSFIAIRYFLKFGFLNHIVVRSIVEIHQFRIIHVPFQIEYIDLLRVEFMLQQSDLIKFISQFILFVFQFTLQTSNLLLLIIYFRLQSIDDLIPILDQRTADG